MARKNNKGGGGNRNNGGGGKNNGGKKNRGGKQDKWQKNKGNQNKQKQGKGKGKQNPKRGGKHDRHDRHDNHGGGKHNNLGVLMQQSAPPNASKTVEAFGGLQPPDNVGNGVLFVLPVTRKELARLFGALDKDQSGSIDIDDVRALGVTEQHHATRNFQLYAQMISEMDEDHDNQVTLAEFWTYFERKAMETQMGDVSYVNRSGQHTVGELFKQLNEHFNRKVEETARNFYSQYQLLVAQKIHGA